MRVFTSIIILLIVIISIAYFARKNPQVATPVPQTQLATPLVRDTRYVDVTTYVRENITHLSPAPAQLGGTFYVTDIEAHDGTGTVHYEDGHNAYVADFSYVISAQGQISITHFKLRP